MPPTEYTEAFNSFIGGSRHSPRSLEGSTFKSQANKNGCRVLYIASRKCVYIATLDAVFYDMLVEKFFVLRKTGLELKFYSGHNKG